MPGAGPTAAAAAAFTAAASPLAASPPAASPPMVGVSAPASAATATSVCWTQAHVKQEACVDEGPLDDDRSRSPVDDSGISPGRSSSSSSSGCDGGAGGSGSSSGGGGGGEGDPHGVVGGGCDSAGPSPDRPPPHWPPVQHATPPADVPYCVQLQLQAGAAAAGVDDGPLRRLQTVLEAARIGQHAKSELASWESAAALSSQSLSFGGMGSSPPPVSSHSHPYGAYGGGGPPRSPGDEPMDVTDADPDGDCGGSGIGDEEPGLREPRVNAQGKVKQYRCKQCPFVAVTKLAFWDHSRTHIKQEKMLTCPKCPFVTEYKHHLEYHLRNHFGSKPFKCDKCPYTCVNKSMLNSHMKSHSSVYQYRCADCSYATKYMHSLKLHLRKYTHKPDMVLNPDGSPNPLPIIDVYGTRRGPKCKPNMTPSRPEGASGGCVADAMVSRFPGAGAFPTAFLLRPPPPPLAYAYNPFLSGFSPFPPMMGNAEEGGEAAAPPPTARSTPTQASTPVAPPPAAAAPPTGAAAAEPVDLSRPDTTPERRREASPPAGPTPSMTSTPDAAAKANRRKGKAYKLERVAMALSSEDEHEDGGAGALMSASPEDYHCSYCAITFRDVVMYTMHMGYHGYADPFTCNMCGHATTDRVSFFLHIARSPHS